MRVKIYIEGGDASHDTAFRAAWTSFFEKAGLKGRMPRPVRCNAREDTYSDFCTAVQTRKSGELPLLLVDSEHLVQKGHDAWKHLKAEDNWAKPAGAGAEDAFLMVVCMETWLIADRKALQRYFRDCWRDKALPQWPELEVLEKEKVIQALKKAAADCGKRRYAKGKVSFEVLGAIDPAVVEAACPSAKRLLDRLRAI